jgi:hypothetical protein
MPPTERAPPPAGPTLIPPTAGTCSSCFYGQTFGTIGGPTPTTVRLCRADPPSTVLPDNLSGLNLQWPVVGDGDWCGDGVDATTYGSFAPDWY